MMKTKILTLCLAVAVFGLMSSANAQFTYTTSEGAITITGYTGSGGAVTIPASVNDSPVTSIGESAFTQCTTLTSVTLPNSITNIGESAFTECTGLTNISISNGVISIGDQAFYGCSSLPKITLPNSVTSIGVDVFDACLSLTNITVVAGNPDFSSMSGVLFNQNQTTIIEFPQDLGEYYVIPDSVTNIGDLAFFSCANLTGVTIPNSVINIGEQAFAYCSGLTSVTFGNSVTTIGHAAFVECIGLTSVTIPNSVTSIEFGAFGNCYGLTSITIGNGVTTLGNYVFSDCVSLTDINFLGNAPVLDAPAEFTDDGVPATVVYYYHGTSGWSSTYGGLPTAELVAYNSPQISNVGVLSSGFNFTVTGASGQTIVVAASTNLANWQPVWTNTLSGTSTNFTDPQWKNYPRRYYRAR